MQMKSLRDLPHFDLRPLLEELFQAGHDLLLLLVEMRAHQLRCGNADVVILIGLDQLQEALHVVGGEEQAVRHQFLPQQIEHLDGGVPIVIAGVDVLLGELQRGGDARVEVLEQLVLPQPGRSLRKEWLQQRRRRLNHE